MLEVGRLSVEVPLPFTLTSKNIQVKKVQSDQYARVPKHGRMLTLFDPVIGLVEL
jgi:hypothetical protein